jgi:hypothetical protein
MFGLDPHTGEEHPARQELVRLAIPRRVDGTRSGACASSKRRNSCGILRPGSNASSRRLAQWLTWETPASFDPAIAAGPLKKTSVEPWALDVHRQRSAEHGAYERLPISSQPLNHADTDEAADGITERACKHTGNQQVAPALCGSSARSSFKSLPALNNTIVCTMTMTEAYTNNTGPIATSCQMSAVAPTLARNMNIMTLPASL